MCGKASSPQANFCYGCGLKFSIAPSSDRSAILKTSDLLTTSDSIIALAGGVIGIVVSEHYSSAVGFTPMIATFFITSLFGVASFAYSTSGLILMIRKKLSKNS
jgi:hypothetical protein